MAGSPKISVPVDLSPFVSVDQRIKSLTAKGRQLDAELKKAAKANKVMPEMLQAAADNRKAIDAAKSESQKAHSTEKALKIAEAREKGESAFEKQVGWAMRANHIVRQIQHAAHLEKAFDDTQGGGGILNGISAVAGVASHIPGPWGKVAKAVELVSGFANEQYQLRKGETASEQEYRRRQKYSEYFTASEKMQHAAEERKMKPFSGGDAGTRELGVALGKAGIGGRNAAEMRDAERYKLQFHQGDMLDKINYTIGIRSAEVEAKLNQKIESVLSSVRSEQSKAISLGNFDSFDDQERRLHAEPGLRDVQWRAASEAWQQDIAANYAKRNFARSQMMRAGPRTGQ